MADRLDTAIANYQLTINEAAAEVRNYVSSVTESYLVILNSFDTSPDYHPTFEEDLSKILSQYNSSFSSSTISNIYDFKVWVANNNLQFDFEMYWHDIPAGSSPEVFAAAQEAINAANATATDILNTFVNTTIPEILNDSVAQINSAVNSLVARIKDARMARLKEDLDRLWFDYKWNRFYRYDLPNALSPARTALSKAKSDIDSALQSIKSRFQSVREFELSIFDTAYRRSKLDEISSDSLDYLNSVLNFARQSVGDSFSYCHFPTQTIDSFNYNVSRLPLYNQEMADYLSSFMDFVSEDIQSMTRDFEEKLQSINNELLSYVSNVTSQFKQLKQELYDSFPKLRFTGNIIIPDQVDWDGTNRFCVEVLNDGKTPVTVWFGWKFRTSTYPQSYTYDIKPDNLCTINPNSSVMCCTDIPFNEVFSETDLRYRSEKQYYIYVIPHLEAT